MTSRQTRRTSSFITQRHGHLQIRTLRGARGTETGEKGTKGDGDTTQKGNETGQGNKTGKGNAGKNKIRENKGQGKQKGAGKQRMGDATGGGRLETKGRERKNNDVTRSTTRKRTINSPTCIFDGPKRTLFYTPRDGGIKAAGKS